MILQIRSVVPVETLDVMGEVKAWRKRFAVEVVGEASVDAAFSVFKGHVDRVALFNIERTERWVTCRDRDTELEGMFWVFGVGDLKYKQMDIRGFKHADVYQMLAYTAAAKLDTGLIIYAAGESEPTTHEINQVSKRIEVMTLDISGSPEDILAEVARVAHHIRSLRERSLKLELTA